MKAYCTISIVVDDVDHLGRVEALAEEMEELAQEAGVQCGYEVRYSPPEARVDA